MSDGTDSQDYAARVRASFARQGLMTTLGASVGAVAPGSVEIVLRPSAAVTQQHGFVHGGAIGAIADTAAGYAAVSVMPPGSGVLTAEFKINLLAPAAGDRIIARGRVLKAGRTLILTQADVFAERAGEEKLIAVLMATMMVIRDREGFAE